MLRYFFRRSLLNNLYTARTIEYPVSLPVLHRDLNTCFYSFVRSFSVSCHGRQLQETAQINKSSALKAEGNAAAEEILANLDPVRAKKLKVIQMEVAVLQQRGAMIPESFLPSWWLRLLNLETSSSRKKFYKYLYKIEKTKMSQEQKKAARALVRAEMEAKRTESIITPKNTIFFHVRKQTMHISYNNKLAQAMMFGPHIILDLGFDEKMVNREIVNLAEQIWMAHGANRLDPDPFHLILTSAFPNSRIVQALKKSSVDKSWEKSMFTVTEKDYLELYPRDQLVYLTPDAKQELKKFSHDDIYIIGGLVDKSIMKPLTMAKAKEQRIRMAKFPLDKHLLWCQGTKSLTIDQVLKILLDLKATNNWSSAFKYVPSRKVLKHFVNH